MSLKWWHLALALVVLYYMKNRAAAPEVIVAGPPGIVTKGRPG